MNSTPRNNFYLPWWHERPSHVSSCNFKGACCGEASFSTAGRLTPVHVLSNFVHPGTQKCCPPASVSPRELDEFKELLPCMTVARECANCEFRAVECACYDNPKLWGMTEMTRRNRMTGSAQQTNEDSKLSWLPPASAQRACR